MTCVIISKAQVLTLNEMKRDQWVWVLVEDFRIREKKLIKYDYGLHFVLTIWLQIILKPQAV